MVQTSSLAELAKDLNKAPAEGVGLSDLKARTRYVALMEEMLLLLPENLAMAELVHPRAKSVPCSFADLINELPPAVSAGVWLYFDDLDKAHAIAQGLTSITGSLWHAIIHRREGDFWNAKHWYRNAGPHPGLVIKSFTLVDEVERRGYDNPADLVEMQRAEWLGLFRWCVEDTVK